MPRKAILAAKGGSVQRRSVEAEYLRVLVFEDEIEVRLRVDGVATTSIAYVWEISKDGEAYVKGRHTVVRVDAEGRPDPLSDKMRARLTG